MRALHVFPLFGPELTNGSDRYQYMLTRQLVERGVAVDILATTAAAIRPQSAFSLAWQADYDRGVVESHGVRIHRFPTTLSVPPLVGRSISRLVFRRWRAEERRYGTMLAGSPHLVEYYTLRARSRPRVYDWMVLLARGPHSAPLLARAARMMRSCDVVLVGFVPFALVWQVASISRLLRRPVVVLPLFHPDDIHHHFRVYYRVLAGADAVLAQTSYSAELFRRLAPGSNPVQVGAGVDLKLFTDPDVSGDRFRQKYGLVGKKIVLVVGRKEPSKRYDLALEAIDLIDDDRIKLVMIGADIDRRPIESPNALHLGQVVEKDLVDAYDACDVFLLPSERESFGMVFLEAWMRNKPVIGNRLCKPVAALIEDGQDGYLCVGAEEIASRIARLVSDPSLARSLGCAGRQKVESRYTWDAIGEKVYDLYRQLARARAAENS